MNIAVNELEHIKEILPVLSETALHELRAFVDYLADRERRRKELVESVLKAEQETPIRFESAEEALQAIINESEKD
jgi:hypothetical protein